jgi:hypothetical protein
MFKQLVGTKQTEASNSKDKLLRLKQATNEGVIKLFYSLSIINIKEPDIVGVIALELERRTTYLIQSN